MTQRFFLNSFLVRASLIVLVALICIQVQFVEAKENDLEFENSKRATTTVRQIKLYINNKNFKLARLH